MGTRETKGQNPTAPTQTGFAALSLLHFKAPPSPKGQASLLVPVAEVGQSRRTRRTLNFNEHVAQANMLKSGELFKRWKPIAARFDPCLTEGREILWRTNFSPVGWRLETQSDTFMILY